MKKWSLGMFWYQNSLFHRILITGGVDILAFFTFEKYLPTATVRLDDIWWLGDIMGYKVTYISYTKFKKSLSTKTRYWTENIGRPLVWMEVWWGIWKDVVRGDKGITRPWKWCGHLSETKNLDFGPSGWSHSWRVITCSSLKSRF